MYICKKVASWLITRVISAIIFSQNITPLVATGFIEQSWRRLNFHLRIILPPKPRWKRKECAIKSKKEKILPPVPFQWKGQKGNNGNLAHSFFLYHVHRSFLSNQSDKKLGIFNVVRLIMYYFYHFMWYVVIKYG